jgi:peptidyl-prolyl cis-trans isomerase SurA
VKLRSLALALPLALFALAAVAGDARAVIVERVVAVVGDRPILLTELRHRARPNLIRIVAAGNKDPNFQAAAETETFKEVLNRMIDEQLIEQAADKSRVSVTAEDVDRGVQNVATNARITVKELMNEVRREGMSEQDYREELRRQILEGKMIELRVRPRVRVTDQDARAAYQHYRQELVDQNPVDLHVLALKMSGPNDTARLALAQQLVQRIRSGENFCTLVSQYSDDTETRATCGSRGAQPMQALIPQIRETVSTMKPGSVSDPIDVPTPTGDAVVILQVAGRPSAAEFDTVKSEMMQRAMLEALERQRKLWLQELRRGIYIDIRL